MDQDYISFIAEIKQNIIRSRYNAAKLANREQLLLYLKVGMRLSEKVAINKWGSAVLQTLANDLQRALPGLKGFSYPSLRNMRQFYEVYRDILIDQSLSATLQPLAFGRPMDCQLKECFGSILQPLVVKFQMDENQLTELFFSIGLSHHLVIIVGCHTLEERYFYIVKAATEMWSRRTLEHHISAGLFKQTGQLPNNFQRALPNQLRTNAMEVFRDNYLFDFLELEESDNERGLESQLVAKIRDAIMALGRGFCFIGNQYRLEVDGNEFFVDLLFYNRLLQCLVAFELKTGKFKPEFAGQLNFYLNVLDDKVKMKQENPSIGIILCKEKNNTVVEYAFHNITSGMGAATFRTTQKVPDGMKGILPDAKELAKLL